MSKNKKKDKIDYLKEDPIIPGQMYALISMMEPRNSSLVSNRESFFATMFLEWFLQENENTKEYIRKNGTKALTPLMKEKLDISYKNIQNLYYEFVKNHSQKLYDKFNKEINKNNEPVVTGLKVRGTYPSTEFMEDAIETFHLNEPAVDIYTIPVGKWVPYLPGGQTGITEEYAEKKLNSLMNQQNIQLQERKLKFDERLKETPKRSLLSTVNEEEDDEKDDYKEIK